MLLEQDRLVLVGCGRMGSALLQGWLDAGIPKDKVIIMDPNPEVVSVWEGRGIHIIGDPVKTLPREPVLLVLAVKPQMANEVVPHVAKILNDESMCVSVMAGIDLKSLKDMGLKCRHIVRAMPNIAALVKQSMTVVVTKDILPSMIQKKVTSLFEAVGKVIWIDQEEDMDLVTALAGSGPALFYRLAETMIESGKAMGDVGVGLDTTTLKTMVEQTFYGSACLLHETKFDVSALRHQVTSPKGTTEAALNQLKMFAESFDAMIFSAVKAAADRSKQMRS